MLSPIAHSVSCWPHSCLVLAGSGGKSPRGCIPGLEPQSHLGHRHLHPYPPPPPRTWTGEYCSLVLPGTNLSSLPREGGGGGLAYQKADAWHHQEPHGGTVTSPNKLGHPPTHTPQSSRVSIPPRRHKNLLLTKHLQFYLGSQLRPRGRNSPTPVQSSPPPHSHRIPPLTGARAPQQPPVQCAEEEGCSPRRSREGRDPAAPAWCREEGEEEEEEEGGTGEDSPKPSCQALGLEGCHRQPPLPWGGGGCQVCSSGLGFLHVFHCRASPFCSFWGMSLLLEACYLGQGLTVTSVDASPLSLTPSHYSGGGEQRSRAIPNAPSASQHSMQLSQAHSACWATAFRSSLSKRGQG